jgi:predicted small metal-binding protein
MAMSVRCECGEVVVGQDADDLVINVQAHAKSVHGGLEVKREDVMAMAQPVADSREQPTN